MVDLLGQLGRPDALERAAGAQSLPPDALVLGACGATGEVLLNHLLGGSRYGRVHAVTRLPLPSTTARLVAHHVPDHRPLASATWPAVEDAYCIIGEHHSYYRRDEGYRALAFDDVLPAAAALRGAGVARLVLVAPVQAYSHSSAFRANLMNIAEYDLFALGFQSLVLVRPAAPEKFVRHANLGKRLGAFLLRQVHGIIPERYHPPSARLVALAAARSLMVPAPGLTVIDADDVRAASA